MGENSALIELITKARRRHAANLLLEQLGVATTAAMTGAVLLLVLGTQILDWHWPFVLFLGGFGLGAFRIRRRLLSAYRLAQRIDQRLNNHDSFSTACHFNGLDGHARFSEPMRRIQREEAERLARGADARRAVPLLLPRAAYPAAALVLIAGTLFALRYGVRHNLDLRPPLSDSLVDFFRTSQQVAALERNPKSPGDQTPSLAVNQLEEASKDSRRTEDSGRPDAPATHFEGLSMDADGSPDLDGLTQVADRDHRFQGADEGMETAGLDRSGSNDPTGPQTPEPGSESPDRRPPQPPGENSDLLDKMRDALANLLARLKIPPRPGEGQLPSSASRTSRRSAGPNSDPNAQGLDNRSRSQGDGTTNADPQNAQLAEGGDPSQSSQADGGERGSDQRGEQESRSSAGRSDGSKDIKEAEQLAAMGKISEIIGRRAANITGEVMVEVASGEQRLRTPYSQSSASHREAGGNVHRDEVPLHLHHYVQQYFEQVHKTPAETSPPAP